MEDIEFNNDYDVEYVGPEMEVSTSLTDEDILKTARSQIRYALYRCKTGNPSEEHLAILEYYSGELDELGFDASDFAENDGWDINRKNTTEVVTGKTVRKYIKELHTPVI